MSETQQHSMQGVVVKKSSAQTVKVAVKFTKVHPIYKKRYTVQRSYVAHDPSDTVQVGEKVTIVSCRPISKIKHWMIQA